MPLRCLLFTGGMLLLVLSPLQRPDAHGCASAPRKGDTVFIAEESALIIWDAAQKTQHFIRWAAFETKAPDFGFLVPTPTQPILAEAADGIFSTLEQWTAPKIVERREWYSDPMFCVFSCASKPDTKSRTEVRVLDQQIVGGFDAAVLEAHDAEALRQWLDKHGYAARSELTAWLGPYLADKWKITAFKIAHDSSTGRRLKTSPVRMSFRTERPFFPYREPEDATTASTRHYGNRLLRVFFIGDERVQGVIGNMVWSARIPWSNPLDDARRAELVQSLALKNEQVPASARLTVFEDSSASRAGKEDVYFGSAPDQSNVLPPDRIVVSRVWIPADLVVLGVLVLGLVLFARRRKNKKRGNPPP